MVSTKLVSWWMQGSQDKAFFSQKDNGKQYEILGSQSLILDIQSFGDQII